MYHSLVDTYNHWNILCSKGCIAVRNLFTAATLLIICPRHWQELDLVMKVKRLLHMNIPMKTYTPCLELEEDVLWQEATVAVFAPLFSADSGFAHTSSSL